jgi:hypothetical protein
MDRLSGWTLCRRIPSCKVAVFAQVHPFGGAPSLHAASRTGLFPPGPVRGRQADTLVVDGSRTTVDDVLNPSLHGFYVSVPAKAATLGLEISRSGVAQTVDLLTGQRGKDAVAVLYRTSPHRIADDSLFIYGYERDTAETGRWE